MPAAYPVMSVDICKRDHLGWHGKDLHRKSRDRHR